MSLASLDALNWSTPFDSSRATRIDLDSRECRAGSVFFALTGGALRGSDFARSAIDQGAIAVVASEALDLPVPVAVVDAHEIHQVLVSASYEIVGNPQNSLRLIGVTGTNGKTSVATFVAELAQLVGLSATSVGTLTHARTTPAPPDLARTLAAARDAGVELVALEVSSHALDQGRVDGLVFDVALFTNLTHDHLDYHETMDRYFAAKASLFTPARSRVGVVYVGDEYAQRLLDEAQIPLRSISPEVAHAATVALSSVTFSWHSHDVHAPLSGRYNVVNVSLALEALSCLGIDDDALVAAVSALSPVPGRYERVAENPTVIVDYAHTPDGLETVLRDVRSLSDATVVVVFGCGGDRDREKRPAMGAIAATYADVVIVTNDNPRSENPTEIADQIESGITGPCDLERVLDRRAAIARGIERAGEHGVVLIAGKGHEKTQETAGTVVEFDDVRVARELLGRKVSE